MQNQLKQADLCSKTISFLRFPLILLVVLIHTSWVNYVPASQPAEDFTTANFCINLITQKIAHVAVPLFFFISGFLYFYKITFSPTVYLNKTLRRVRTLLLPFLLWTIPMILCIIVARKLGIPLASDASHKVETLFDWAVAIYGGSNKQGEFPFPLLGQFWFLRDLFMVGLLSPLWYFLLKRGGLIFLSGMAVVWFSSIDFCIPGYSPTAIFFFCAGAYFSIYERDFVKDFSNVTVPAIIAYTILLIADVFTENMGKNHSIHSLFICISCVALVSLVANGIKKGILKEVNFFTSATFFVYALHNPYFNGPIDRFICTHIYQPSTSFALIAIFIAKPVVVVAICLGAFWFTRKFFPKIAAVLSGGRM